MRYALLLVWMSVSTQLPAGVIASSTFGGSAEGWTAVTADTTSATIPVVTSAGVNFQAAGGNPGGFVQYSDPDGSTTYFVAPAAFLGNQLAALFGSLQYQLRYQGALDYNDYDVVLKGGGLVLVYDIPIPSLNPNTFSPITVNLAPDANWRVRGTNALATVADFQTALAAVSDLWILAEYTNGISETADLDNVALNSTDVPESASTLLCGVVLMALGLLRRRTG